MTENFCKNVDPKKNAGNYRFPGSDTLSSLVRLASFALHYTLVVTTNFFSKHCIKRVLDAEINGYHCWNLTEKRSYKIWTLSNT